MTRKILKHAALAAFVGLGLAISAQPAAADVIYDITGDAGGFYNGIELSFTVADFITVPYTVTSPTICTACQGNAQIVSYSLASGEAGQVNLYQAGGGYAMYFAVADFAALGSYTDNLTHQAQMTVTLAAPAADVPEPLSLLLLGSGLAGLALTSRRRNANTAQPLGNLSPA